MKIRFRYPSIPEFTVPDDALIGEFNAKTLPQVPPPQGAIARALANPIGAPPLREAVQGSRRVLVLVDDITRQTPADVILPLVLDELHAGGVKDRGIAFLVAGGTHRPLTREEKAGKLGEKVVEQYRVLDHRWDKPRGLADLGTLSNGWPVVVDRHLPEADFVLGIGHIVPHRIFGYSGGVKIVLPGVAGKPSVNRMHWEAAQYPADALFGIEENPIRQLGNEFAQRVGLKYIVNVVQDDQEHLVGAFAGDPIAAYAAGVKVSRDIYQVELPELADVCIAESYPADIDMWQAIKGYYSMQLCVRHGGAMVLVAPLPEGISHAHPQVARIGFHTLPEIQQLIWSDSLEPGAAAAMLAYGGQAAKERATGVLVSPHVEVRETKRMGLVPAKTPAEGLEIAREIVGRNPKVTVLHHGGEIFPHLAGT